MIKNWKKAFRFIFFFFGWANNKQRVKYKKCASSTGLENYCCVKICVFFDSKAKFYGQMSGVRFTITFDKDCAKCIDWNFRKGQYLYMNEVELYHLQQLRYKCSYFQNEKCFRWNFQNYYRSTFENQEEM